MAHDIGKEMADQPSGVPAGSEHQAHDSGYNEPRSEMSCQTTAAAQDCTGWSSPKLWDIKVSIYKARNSLFPVPNISNHHQHLLSFYFKHFESPFSPILYQLFIIITA